MSANQKLEVALAFQKLHMPLMKPLARRQTFQKPSHTYGQEHIKIELTNQGKWNCHNFPLKYLLVNFGNSILDKSNWEKISEGIIKKIQTWNTVRLSLRSKKTIVNQILLSKQWHIRQILQKYVKNISKGKLKEHTISPGTIKNTTIQGPSSTLHLERWTRYFGYRISN